MRYYITLILSVVILCYSCTSKQDSSHSDHHSHMHDDNHDHGHEDDCCDHEHDDIDLSDAIEFSDEQAELIGLETEIVTPREFSHVIKTSAQILPAQGDETTVVATTNGIVDFVSKSIAEGTAIRSGETMMTISARKLLDGEPFSRAKAEYEAAASEYNRAVPLAQEQIISAKDFEQIKLRYETSKSAYQAHASSASSQGIKITSPLTGFIKNKLVTQGEYVSVGQSLMTISQNKKLTLRAEVAPRHYKALSSLSDAHFRPSYEDKVYVLSELQGRILSRGRGMTNKSALIPITFEFEDTGSNIVPGSFGEVYLIGVSSSDILTVPTSAIIEEQGLHFVFIKINSGHYKKQEVSLGVSDGLRIEVLSGLSEEDEVVTKGAYRVKLASLSTDIPHGHSH